MQLFSYFRNACSTLTPRRPYFKLQYCVVHSCILCERHIEMAIILDEALFDSYWVFPYHLLNLDFFFLFSSPISSITRHTRSVFCLFLTLSPFFSYKSMFGFWIFDCVCCFILRVCVLYAFIHTSYDRINNNCNCYTRRKWPNDIQQTRDIDANVREHDIDIIPVLGSSRKNWTVRSFVRFKWSTNVRTNTNRQFLWTNGRWKI